MTGQTSVKLACKGLKATTRSFLVAKGETTAISVLFKYTSQRGLSLDTNRLLIYGLTYLYRSSWEMSVVYLLVGPTYGCKGDVHV